MNSQSSREALERLRALRVALGIEHDDAPPDQRPRDGAPAVLALDSLLGSDRSEQGRRPARRRR